MVVLYAPQTPITLEKVPKEVTEGLVHFDIQSKEAALYPFRMVGSRSAPGNHQEISAGSLSSRMSCPKIVTCGHTRYLSSVESHCKESGLQREPDRSEIHLVIVEKQSQQRKKTESCALQQARFIDQYLSLRAFLLTLALLP